MKIFIAPFMIQIKVERSQHLKLNTLILLLTGVITLNDSSINVNSQMEIAYDEQHNKMLLFRGNDVY